MKSHELNLEYMFIFIIKNEFMILFFCYVWLDHKVFIKNLLNFTCCKLGEIYGFIELVKLCIRKKNNKRLTL